MIEERIFNMTPIIQRNWELQFVGSANNKILKSWLFENEDLNKIIPESIIEKYYDLFINGDSIKYSHSISMLLTISVWAKRIWAKS